MDFVDLIGASGRSYRFRVWPGPAHPPIAGNYLVYDLDKTSPITFGLLENLAEAATRVGRLPPRAKLHPVERLAGAPRG